VRFFLRSARFISGFLAIIDKPAGEAVAVANDRRSYRKFVDNLHDGVYMLDRRRHIVYWNRGAERITGYSRAEVLGRFCGDALLMHTDLHGTLLCGSLCPAMIALRDGRIREEDILVRHKDGRPRAVRVRVVPIPGPADEFVGTVESFSDNPARLAAMDKLEELGNETLLDLFSDGADR
jgi:PAS domain S-box-containing protein